MYIIEREEYVYVEDTHGGNDDITLASRQYLPVTYNDHEEAGYRIKDFANAFKKEANRIDHHPGQSVVYFDWGYIQFTRSHDIQNIS